METYFVIGKYSTEAVREISANRTEQSVRLIRELGGQITSMHALLGGLDMILIVNYPSSKIAMKASLSLTKLTGISFTTYPAMTLVDFDNLISG